VVKPFKVLYGSELREMRKRYGDLPDYIPWGIVAPHEKQAIRNHDQTLEVLNERGGLDPRELYAIVHSMSWRDVSRLDMSQCVEWLKLQVIPINVKVSR
jgi:hypothetical protein